MSSDEGGAEGGQARTTAPTEGALAVASDDTASGAEPQQLPAAPPGASAGRPTGGEKGSMAERDRVWASASALGRASPEMLPTRTSDHALLPDTCSWLYETMQNSTRYSNT